MGEQSDKLIIKKCVNVFNSILLYTIVYTTVYSDTCK